MILQSNSLVLAMLKKGFPQIPHFCNMILPYKAIFPLLIIHDESIIAMGVRLVRDVQAAGKLNVCSCFDTLFANAI